MRKLGTILILIPVIGAFIFAMYAAMLNDGSWDVGDFVFLGGIASFILGIILVIVGGDNHAD